MKWTAYTASVTEPMIESITEDGETLSVPGYEAVADQITVDEVYSNMVATWLTLEAKEPGYVLDRLASQLDRDLPIRLLLASHPVDGVCRATLLPTAVIEMAPNNAMLVVCGRRDDDNDLPMRRDFWFGKNFNLQSMGFTPIKEES